MCSRISLLFHFPSASLLHCLTTLSCFIRPHVCLRYFCLRPIQLVRSHRITARWCIPRCHVLLLRIISRWWIKLRNHQNSGGCLRSFDLLISKQKLEKPNICLIFVQSIRHCNNSACKYLENKCSSSSSMTQINMDENWRRNSRTFLPVCLTLAPSPPLPLTGSLYIGDSIQPSKSNWKEKKRKKNDSNDLRHFQWNIDKFLYVFGTLLRKKAGKEGEKEEEEENRRAKKKTRLGKLYIKMSDATIENFKFLFATPRWQHRIHIHSLVVNRFEIVRCQYIIKTAINSEMSGGGGSGAQLLQQHHY